jgi:prepilin-type N-terminal cleavage/methylation domain-containing protein
MKAFTLVEILIAIVIVALLVGIVVGIRKAKSEVANHDPVKYLVTIYSGAEPVKVIEARLVIFSSTRVVIDEAKTGRRFEVTGTVISEPIGER